VLAVAGQTNSADFPVTAGADQIALAGGWDAFATVLDPTSVRSCPRLRRRQRQRLRLRRGDGRRLRGAPHRGHELGRPAHDADAAQRFYAGNIDAFVARFAIASAARVHMTYLGGHEEDQASASCRGARVGRHASRGPWTSPPRCRSRRRSPPAPASSRVTRPRPTRSCRHRRRGRLAYSTYYGGSGDDVGTALAWPAGGRVHDGRDRVPRLPLRGEFQNALRGEFDALVGAFEVTSPMTRRSGSRATSAATAWTRAGRSRCTTRSTSRSPFRRSRRPRSTPVPRSPGHRDREPGARGGIVKKVEVRRPAGPRSAAGSRPAAAASAPAERRVRDRGRRLDRLHDFR